MHELAISQNILDVAKAHMEGQQRLKKVVVECGPFSGIVAEALDYCFSVTALHMGYRGAALEIHELEAQAVCPVCRTQTAIKTMWATCDQCGHAPLTAQGGRELRVTSIEVEEARDV